MFDRKTILAIIVVGLILFLLPKYYELISPKRPEAATPAPVAIPDTAGKAPEAAPAPVPQAAIPPPVVRADVLFGDTLPPEADYVRIETPRYSMTIASNGRVSSYFLKHYSYVGGGPVRLHREAGKARTAIGYLDFNLGHANIRSLESVRFVADKRRVELVSGEDRVRFVTEDASGRSVVLTYTFDAALYGFRIALETKGLAVPETGEFEVRWIGGVPVTEPDTARDVQYSGAYALVGAELEKVTAGRDREKEFTATGQTSFVAARSKYFMAAVIPDQPAAGVEIRGRHELSREKVSPHLYDLTLRESWGANAAGSWTVYWGPMRYENLKALNVGLENTMNWGWAIIKPFSISVLWALTALHKVITNYGIVIIIFSVIVKIVLWPLTRKSQISMKKMSALQPEIQALREQHSKNPQAMNQAIMALYKERGVNPASGCIPLLLQMPLLYALFVIFSSTIEFRQAPFVFWITDLSLPDWVYTLPFSIPMYGAHVAVLPFIMAVTQFFMSKRTTTDPNQKFMLYVMPVFMLLIFNNLPSGLTFYYTLFNVLAMVEQQLIKLPDFTPSVEVVQEKKGKKRS